MEAERARLTQNMAKVEKRIERSQTLLAGEFAHKAPPTVVQREREKLHNLQIERNKIAEQLAALES